MVFSNSFGAKNCIIKVVNKIRKVRRVLTQKQWWLGHASASVTPLTPDGWNICQDCIGIVLKARELIGRSAFITCMTAYKDVRQSPSLDVSTPTALWDSKCWKNLGRKLITSTCFTCFEWSHNTIYYISNCQTCHTTARCVQQSQVTAEHH